VASLADRLDAFQQRHRVVGFPLAVTYKFFDDQSNYLAATVTYYSFAAIFPLLLISSQVFGFLLQGNEELQKKMLDSTLSQFPIVGTALGTPQGLTGSAGVVAVGIIAALYGILGLGQAAQNAIHVAYAIPRNSRPNPFLSRVHSGLLLMVAGLVLVVVATITSLAANAEVFGVGVNFAISLAVSVVSAVLTASVLALMMRVAMPDRPPFRQLLPGALATAVLWQALQRLGRFYVSHVVARATDFNALFALTLGLLALLYVAANMGVIGIQINVVLTRHLWPRALLTPFTDAVELTEADRRAYVAYAQAQRHKGFERVEVTFDKGDDPDSSS
jgi:uncharacterized BrkB/YihY/UPF0761 family membrane protein